MGAGELDGDGRAEIITGPGNGGPNVRVFDGLTATLRSSFYAFDPVSALVPLVAAEAIWDSSVRVTTTHLFGHKDPVIAVGPGPGFHPEHQSQVRYFDLHGQELDQFTFDGPGFLGGVFVGGS